MNSMKMVAGIFTAGVGLVIAILIFYSSYNNTLVASEENVHSSWAQVESNYQRRADLVPNLVATVKGYAKHEHDVLTEVAQARSGLADMDKLLNDTSSANEDAKKALVEARSKLSNDAYMASLASAQGRVGQFVTRVFAVVEQYPDLKASDNFMALQSQLEGTENRINVARLAYNEAVQKYNELVRSIPSSFVAAAKGMVVKSYFEAEAGAEKKVKVEF